MILGPWGSGKTLHGRHLAKKLGLFHIQYRERLQELVIAKTKKKIGPEFEVDQEEPEEEEEEECVEIIIFIIKLHLNYN
jgi:adenylate/nucleoside-diphosphate kinase